MHAQRLRDLPLSFPPEIQTSAQAVQVVTAIMRSFLQYTFNVPFPASLAPLLESLRPRIVSIFDPIPDTRLLQLYRSTFFRGDLKTAMHSRCAWLRAATDIISRLIGMEVEFALWHMVAMFYRMLADSFYSKITSDVKGSLYHLAIHTNAKKEIKTKQCKVLGEIADVDKGYSEFSSHVDVVSSALAITRIELLSRDKGPSESHQFVKLLSKLSRLVESEILDVQQGSERQFAVTCTEVNDSGVVCNERFKLKGKQYLNHLKEDHGLEVTDVKTVPEKPTDVFGYGIFIKAIKRRLQEGDGASMYSYCFRFLHLFFRAHHRTNYAANIAKVLIFLQSVDTERTREVVVVFC